MGWQILQLSQQARLSLESNQCSIYFVENQEKISIPLDNLNAVILESHLITVSSALLQSFAENKIAVFVCDKSHIPNGILLPFMQYFTYTKVAYQQIAWSEPFKKRCWQKVIETKILNQAKVLGLFNKQIQADKLKLMSKMIQAGDSANVEGQAAALYWKTLFGPSFNREQESFINSALNYGYAILRGIVARSLVGNGFIPCFGIHHNNQFNAFNLADDLLEQFRPLVDWQVLNMDESNSLERKEKAMLLELLVKEYSFEEEERSLLNICEQITDSLLEATTKKEYKRLKVFRL